MAWWNACTNSTVSTIFVPRCYTIRMCLCVNITACGVLISPETVSTDGVFISNTGDVVHGAGGKDDVQMVTLEERRGLFYLETAFSACCRGWCVWACLSQQQKKNKKYIRARSERSVLVLYRAHSTTHCQERVVEIKNLADIVRQKDKKRGERNRRFTWWGPLCPPAWRPAPHAARPLIAAAAPAPHLDLC